MMSTVATALCKPSTLHLRSLLPLILAGLLLPAAAWAQVTYTGTAANQNFGSRAVGSTSTAKTFSFSVASGTTVGSIGVVTTGIANESLVGHYHHYCGCRSSLYHHDNGSEHAGGNERSNSCTAAGPLYDASI